MLVCMLCQHYRGHTTTTTTTTTAASLRNLTTIFFLIEHTSLYAADHNPENTESYTNHTATTPPPI